MKGEVDLLELCRSNASILYPQYPPSSLQVTISQTSGRLSPLYYVALFAMVIDPATGLATPRLLESGPPKPSIDNAVLGMLEPYLARRVSKVVNEQAVIADRVQWKEGEISGYRFVWPDDIHGPLTLAPTSSTASTPPANTHDNSDEQAAPPTYEESRRGAA